MKIAYIVGSLASQSLNRGLAKALASLAPEGVEFVELPIADLPLYNRDYDGHWPEVATRFKQGILDADGVLLITPEHNRMYSAALANALEWSSRPWGTAALVGKPVAIAGVSPSQLGTALAQSHLRGPLNFCAAALGSPPALSPTAPRAGAPADGDVAEESRDYLAGFVEAFVERIRTGQ